MREFQVVLSAVAVLSLVAVRAHGQGPDVILADIPTLNSYGNGGSGTTYAYSLATTACNVGSVPLFWYGLINQHPVLAQNIYRLKNGRFEQIGMSWLKHGVGAGVGSLCGGCQPTLNPGLLGVGCSDPYTANTNGYQSTLGPRSDVNPTTGYFPFPPTDPPWSGVVARRLQCQANDINPALNGAALYFAEGQYVTPTDAAAGNQNNNASYRRITFAGGTFAASVTGATFQQQAAIYAWQAADPAVVIETLDIPGDGRFLIAKKATSHGPGAVHYEFAVRNMTSDRAARGFTVNFPAGTSISSPGFKDIPYHSGEPYSGTDWPATINGSSITWATEPYSVNPNANALRWGTLYNFWFEATAPAESGKSIEPFKCPVDPVFGPIDDYVLDKTAPFDNPTITGTAGPTANDTSLNAPIGFTFNFWTVPYTSVWISSNGFLTFAAAGAGEPVNACVPSPAAPHGVIAGYWSALDLASGGQIRYQTIGTAPNRRFVVHWQGLHDAGTSELEDFKVILDETTNKITSTTLTSGYGGATSTRGVERQDDLVGVQGACNLPGTSVANTSWTYVPVSGVMPSAPLTIGGSTGPNGIVTFSINSNANSAPVVLVASVDPGPTSLGALGVLNVGFPPAAFVFVADGLTHPNDFTSSTCGVFERAVPVGPAGLPPGFTIYIQGGVISATSVPPPPNGSFHLTNVVVLNT